MQKTQWRRVEELYHLALEHSPGERAAFLDKACAGDSALKHDVEALLESADGVPEFLLCPDRQPDLRPGATLGPYLLVGWIGCGGMGEVWKARDTRLNCSRARLRTRASLIHRYREERGTFAPREEERRGRDSNPRGRLSPPTRFPVALLKPLGHLSRGRED